MNSEKRNLKIEEVAREISDNKTKVEHEVIAVKYYINEFKNGEIIKPNIQRKSIIMKKNKRLQCV